MAFRSNGPVMVALPPFRGVTRLIILTALCVFLGLAVLALVLPSVAAALADHLLLTPLLAVRGQLWQFVTYAFMPSGLLSLLFALLSMWFFGAALEDELGSQWLLEYFFASTVGGALLASLLSYAIASHAPELGPANSTAGLWPAVLAILLAYARFHAEEPLRFNFILTVKAKYLAAIYLLIYLAMALVGGNRFGALVAVCAAACGFIYLRFAPRRGLSFATSEGWYGLRNEFYKAKRRRAAKKFTVYMRKQGKDVSIDDDGRYVDPNGRSRNPRNPNDKRWMN